MPSPRPLDTTPTSSVAHRASGLTSRRRCLVGLVTLTTTRLPNAAAADGRSAQQLFRIERSTNANYVRYDAAKVGEATLDPKAPVRAYWVLAAENGRREALSSMEARAYGFQVRPEGPGRWLLVLRAAPNRSIRVLRWGDRWAAQIVIAKRSAVLERLFVSVDDGGIVPKVRWVDIFGTDMETSAPLRERVKA